MPGLRRSDDPDTALSSDPGGDTGEHLQGALVPEVPEDAHLGAAGADGTDGGAGTGPDRAMGWFAADAARCHMSLTSYLREHGIIGPHTQRRIWRHEATGFDLEGIEDCD